MQSATQGVRPLSYYNVEILKQGFHSQNASTRYAARIHRQQKDGGCTFYHNTLRTKQSPLGIWKRYGLVAVVPTLTALLLSSLKDLQYFFVLLYAL